MTVSVCMPAFPPMPATTGMNIATAASSSMVPSNSPTTSAARKAVARFTPSQGRRLRNDSPAGVNARSSPATPASR
ncbi:hypothetical protein D3C83_51140 [compost metagenome]